MITKDFLRYHILGVIFMLWTLAFLAPYFSYTEFIKHIAGENRDIAAVLTLLGTFGGLLPIGVLIHEISISCHSINFLRSVFIYTDGSFSDTVRTLSKARPQCDIDNFDIKSIKEDISNRYSYCYVRVDNGFFAPLCGGIVASFVLNILKIPFFKEHPSFSICWPAYSALFIAIFLISYVPRLLKEITELELFLLQSDKRKEIVSKLK